MRAGPLWLALGLAACTSELTVLRPKSGMPPPGSDADVASPDASAVEAGTAEAGMRDEAGPGAAVDAGGMPPPRATGEVVGAFRHTCALSNGVVHCWGLNAGGQLGLGDTMDRLTPTRVSGFDDFVDLCAGEAHSCGLRADGSAWCWGQNLRGELGVGDTEPRLLPAKIEGLRFVRLACGGYNTCGLEAHGALSCWGDNWEGKIGQDDPFESADFAVPTRVAGDLTFRDVSVGQGHVCAVSYAGTLYCWGRNQAGQLADASSDDQVRAPRPVDATHSYRKVAAGQQHTCGILHDGRLFCWGGDNAGMLGIGAPGGMTRVPVQVGTESDYRDIQASWFHTCAVRENQALYCWGRNVEGQLGLGDVNDRSTPARVGSGNDWGHVAIGHFHTCGFRGESLYCWGANDTGQLGTGGTDRLNEPGLIAFP